MADQSDVETALAGMISAALYPSGADQPSLPGPLCRIYRGWPNSAALDDDLAAGWINVTVFPSGGAVRNTTRYPTAWSASPRQPTLTFSIGASSVTFGGSADPGQIAGLIVGEKTYTYATAPGDTPAMVAAQLAAMARAGGVVVLSGATVTIPGASKIAARVAAGAVALREMRRQTQDFRVTCWCPSPATRDQAAGIIDQAFAQVGFIPLPDGSQARIVFAGGAVVDQLEDAQLYRRDLLYSVEYATTVVQEQPPMLFGDAVVNAISFIG